MTVVLGVPSVAALRGVVQALRDWQYEGAPMQLHPGDLGWFWRFGTAATAAAVRTWSRGGRILAIGLLDGPTVLRVTTDPDARGDEELARRILEDLSDPSREVLPAGKVVVDAPQDAVLQELLAEEGWDVGDAWTPLSRDCTMPLPDPALRIEVVGPPLVGARTAVQRSAFARSTFTEDRWRTMAAGPAYTDARCLVAFDGEGVPVAAVTVWSAGPGKPGLLEPMGVHPRHRRRGHGTAITVAAAATLRSLGSSGALVCTPSSNVAAVATYRAAGFRPLAEVRDRLRP